jgi:hypothetical protein
MPQQPSGWRMSVGADSGGGEPRRALAPPRGLASGQGSTPAAGCERSRRARPIVVEGDSGRAGAVTSLGAAGRPRTTGEHAGGGGEFHVSGSATPGRASRPRSKALGYGKVGEGALATRDGAALAPPWHHRAGKRSGEVFSLVSASSAPGASSPTNRQHPLRCPCPLQSPRDRFEA